MSLRSDAGSSKPNDVAAYFASPSARVVLAVCQQALLTPLGAERVLVGIRRPGGRFTMIATDASNRPERARSSFLWSQAAPMVAALRTQITGLPGVAAVGDRHLFRYAMGVEESNEQVVVGVLLDRHPEDIDPLHASVCSAIYSLLPASDRDIPDASVSVAVIPVEGGHRATVTCLVDDEICSEVHTASTEVEAIARATIAASGSSLNLRFADQVVVEGCPVSLIVADSAAGPVVGSSSVSGDGLGPSRIAISLAVLKANNAAARIETELAHRAEQLISAT